MRIDVTMTASEVTRELGLRLAQLRIARNLTQAQLARKAGVGLSSVIRLERGCESVGLDIFIAVCSALALTGNFDQCEKRVVFDGSLGSVEFGAGL